MPAGSRIRGNNSFGITTDAPLTAGATTFNSAGLVTLPVVSAAHAVIVLDPKRLNGEPEIVVVTAHTAAATVATIVRGQYGTVAHSHPAGTPWAHVPVDEDYIEILTSGTRPSNPYEGQLIYETDTDVLRGYNGSAWGTTYLDPPACRVFHNAAQSIGDAVGGGVQLVFNSERYDTDNMHSTTVDTGRITFNTAGLYLITFSGTMAASNDYNFAEAYIKLNGTTTIATSNSMQHNVILAAGDLIASTVYKFTATQWVGVWIYQDSTGAKNMLANGNHSPEFSACWIGKG